MTDEKRIVRNVGIFAHVWHTHPLDFAVATAMGIMKGLAQTGTTLLEPMLQVRITVPEEFGGKVLSDLVQMRGALMRLA